MKINRRWLIVLAAAIAVAVVGLLAGPLLDDDELPAGIVAANGRVEAVEINVAAKAPGRLAAIEVNEGDFVRAGDVIARMDVSALEAQKRQAEAQLRQAEAAVEVMRSQVAQRESERAAALALVEQREAELAAARKRLERTSALAKTDTVSRQQLDDVTAAFHQARAAVAAGKAQAEAAQAGIATAKSQLIGAQADVDAVKATIERLQTEIDDGVLRAPRDGRIQYRVAQPGEVVGAGGTVVNLLDVGDVYMSIFLPTPDAGRLAIGAEARLVLDAAPQYVIPATVSFVADVAQFTPKTVETAEERQKLMFRVKLKVPPDLLQKYLVSVKTGLPGVGYVRVDSNVEWPAELQVKLPQ